MISDLRLAELAAQSYEGPWDWESPGRVQARRFDEGGYVVVSIPGTTRDGFSIIRDVRFIPWWSPDIGVVPAGPYKGARDIVLRILNDLAAEIKAGKVIFIGHSLGGQVAFMVAGILVALGDIPAGVVAFDPSRAGMWKLRRLIAKVPYAKMFWNGVDVVPLVPPGFMHPARCEYLGTKRSRWRVLVDVLRGRVKADICPAITDHRIGSIIASIKAAEGS